MEVMHHSIPILVKNFCETPQTNGSSSFFPIVRRILKGTKEGIHNNKRKYTKQHDILFYRMHKHTISRLFEKQLCSLT